MDRVLNPKDEKQTIYEIYRACRLCGAGAGYKMPIIQSVVDLDGDGVELRQKIKECIQIEVNHTDRMPPLICELCVDKVNDFYEFMNLCHTTNKRTRLRLGLPIQTKSIDSQDSENCIFGVTEPILPEPGPRNKKRVKNEPVEVVQVKSEKANGNADHARSASPQRRRFASPPRRTRFRNESLSSDTMIEESPLAIDRSKKRSRDTEARIDTPGPAKRAKLPDKPRDTPKVKPKSRRNELEQLLLSSPDTERQRERERERETFLKVQRSRLSSKVEAKPPNVTTDAAKAKTLDAPVVKTKLTTETSKQKAPPSRQKNDASSKQKIDTSKQRNDTSSKSKNDSSSKLKNDTTTKSRNDTPNKQKTDIPSKRVSNDSTKTPAKSTKVADTKFICSICQTQVKTNQGLSTHRLVKHSPTFTLLKMACNACELWFPTADAAAAHHRAHQAQDQPYKCLRCYGYFKLLHEYTDHFAEQQCLSAYEVPDVQCWQCRREFPTNKLKDEHACPGEDGRPGGKCSKCNRSYALLKNQLKHEATCVYKKKGEVSIEPGLRARLRDARVRLARCDPLLEGGPVNVANVSHKYGLDSNATYPYLPSEIKREPKHMVSIDDAVKEEFWDHHSNDSQTVDSLSNISLKSINKTDSIENDDLAKKIFSIIDNLADDATNDSDSVLINASVDKSDPKPSVSDQSVTAQSDKCESNKQSVMGGESAETNDDSNDVVSNDRVNDNVDGNLGANRMDVDETSNLTSTSVENSVESKTKDVCEDKNVRDDASEASQGNESDETNDSRLTNDSEQIRLDSNTAISKDTVIDSQNFSSASDNVTKNDTVDSSNKLIQDCSLDDNVGRDVIDNSQSDGIDKLKVADSEPQETDKVKSENVDPEKVENNTKLPVTDEEFSKIDEITSKILKETESSSNAVEKAENSDPQSDFILNSCNNSNDSHTRDKFNVDDLNDEDKKLMEELDAQIAENKGNLTENSQEITKPTVNNTDLTSNDIASVNNVENEERNHENDDTAVDTENSDVIKNGDLTERSNSEKSKHYLIDNLLKKDDLKSLELDNVSDDEFNFDS